MPCCCKKQKTVVENDNYQKMTNSSASTLLLLSNPSFYENLPNDFYTGSKVTIKGYLGKHCSRFGVNFVSEKDENADIAFHLNPRIAQKCVVRNKRISGHWGTEENSLNCKFDDLNLKANSDFVIEIFAIKNEYFVSINNQYVCNYVNKSYDTLKIKALEVWGNVEVKNVDFKKINAFPENGLDAFSVPSGIGLDNLSDTDQKLPFMRKLPKGLKEGGQLEIYGRVRILPHSFYINLQEGFGLWPHPIIHLHINPRFEAKDGHGVIVRNSWLNGKWDQEERCSGRFPFLAGDPFSIAIRRESKFFSFWINGKLIGEFKYRTVPDKIDTVYIQGDLTVRDVYFNEKIDDNYHEKNLIKKYGLV